MSTASAPARRPVLTLPGKASNGAAEAKAVSEPQTAPQRRPRGEPYHVGQHVREFAFEDGRPIAIHRHAVRFACPLKDDPENLTLVGIKDTQRPCPLRVTYVEFVAWWKDPRNE